MLTDLQCRKAAPRPSLYKLADGLGLSLWILPSGVKSWRFKYRIGGVEKLLTIGKYPQIPPAEARLVRDRAREQLRNGVDPSIDRKQRRAEVKAAIGVTVRKFAEDWHAKRKAAWKPRYARVVMNRLKLDVFPAIGRVPIADVTAPMVLEVIRRAEDRGSIDVAHRLRQHLEDIFAMAVVSAAMPSNPAAGLSRAMETYVKGQRPAVRSVEDARDVLAAVEAMNVMPSTRLATRLLALTWARPGMVRMAAPEEFERLDGSDPIWRIPAAKMKLTARRSNDLRFEFVIPLSPAAVDVVRTALRLATADLLFPGARRRSPISDSTLSKVHRAAGFRDVHVPHGWRATGSTVMNEIAAIENRVGDREIIDLMLAHVPDNVESAYNRYAYLPRRRQLALEWAGMVMKGAAPADSLLAPRQRGFALAAQQKAPQHDRGLDAAPVARPGARPDGKLARKVGARG